MTTPPAKIPAVVPTTPTPTSATTIVKPRVLPSGLPKLFRTKDLKTSFGTVLGYGPAGAGKTRSIRTLIDAGFNPLILVTELGQTGGLLSLASSDVPYIVLNSHAQAIDVIRELKKKPGKIEYDQTEFGAVVLDSITQWGEYPLERYMQLKMWDDLHGPNEKGGGKDPRTAYGFLAEKGRQLYKELFELHGHLYIIAREGIFGDGSAEMPLFAAPELPGQKLPREVPGWPDATVRLRIIAGQHMMVTKGEGGSPARVRQPEGVPQLPTRCNPDIGSLIKLMCGDQSAYAKLIPVDARAAAAAAKAAPPTTTSTPTSK
jgi:hypothetical protein